MKRALDVVIAATALLLLSPLMLLAAVAVLVTTGAPVLFRQKRAGRGGRPFELLKFRTMRAATAGEEGPAHDIERITRIGSILRRTSIDELPSLVNVLRGEMSIVGPRPLPVAYVERYNPQQAKRLEVLPGLTGWAVVHGRNQLEWDERFELDCWYVEHRSLALDLRIIGRTVALVLRGDAVNHAPGITMREFTGGHAADPVVD